MIPCSTLLRSLVSGNSNVASCDRWSRASMIAWRKCRGSYELSKIIMRELISLPPTMVTCNLRAGQVIHILSTWRPRWYTGVCVDDFRNRLRSGSQKTRELVVVRLAMGTRDFRRLHAREFSIPLSFLKQGLLKERTGVVGSVGGRHTTCLSSTRAPSSSPLRFSRGVFAT